MAILIRHDMEAPATVADDPQVIEARARLQDVRERRAAAITARDQTERAILAEPDSVASRRLARHLTALRDADDDAAAEETVLVAAVTAATSAARDRILRAHAPARRALVQRLDQALHVVEMINGEILQQTRDVGQAVAGEQHVLSRWGAGTFSECMPETPLQDSRVAAWRRAQKAHGWL